jgi:hypothetical protein
MDPIAIVSVIPVGLVLAFQTTKVPIYMLLIPIYNVVYVLKEATLRNFISSNLSITAVSMIIYTILGIGLSTKFFNNEGILNRI